MTCARKGRHREVTAGSGTCLYSRFCSGRGMQSLPGSWHKRLPVNRHDQKLFQYGGSRLFNWRDCCGLYYFTGPANALFAVIKAGQRALLCTVIRQADIGSPPFSGQYFYIHLLCVAVDLHNNVNVYIHKLSSKRAYSTVFTKTCEVPASRLLHKMQRFAFVVSCYCSKILQNFALIAYIRAALIQLVYQL